MNEQGFCEECEEGIILKDGLCFNENNCIEKNGDICIKCGNKNDNSYSCLNSVFGCVDTTIKNCIKCEDIYNFNNCTKCEEGMKLNDEGICVEI